MKRLLTLLLALLISFAHSQEPPRPTPRPAAQRTTTLAPARLEEVDFASPSLARTVKYRVLLPAGYAASQRRYPVLYLLHGLWGGHEDWNTRTRLATYIESLDWIVVMPDVGDSWYANSLSNPTDRFEDYIVKDLIPEVDRRYRTIGTRHGRAVAGLSMGGYGAFKFALKYPHEFVAAGSFSGAFDRIHPPELPDPNDRIAASVTAILGPLGSENRRAADVLELARNARPGGLPFLYFDCGTDDFLIRGNVELAAILREKKIRHEYRELPGAHTWEYWDRQLREWVQVLQREAEAFRRASVTAR